MKIQKSRDDLLARMNPFYSPGGGVKSFRKAYFWPSLSDKDNSMKFAAAIPIAQIAEWMEAEIIGSKDQMVTGMNEIHKVEPGDLTFVDVQKYFRQSLESAATVIVINERIKAPKGKSLLLVDRPFDAYNALALRLNPFSPTKAIIDPTAEIHESVILEPNVVIGKNVKIGAHSYIQANAYIGNDTIIGEHVKIQVGAILGTDAFYYKKKEQTYEKWHSIGRVVIEDWVDIGAGCTINRGVSGDTVIGAGSKLDCQVHIGHGAVIGKNCLLAGQVGIGGKTILEDEVVLYGQVGVAQSLRIGKGAVVAAKSGVSKSLEGGQTYFGSPAAEIRTKHRELAALRHLPEFYKNYYE